MSIFGVATPDEKEALSTQLALLYLEKSDVANLSPAEFAEKFFEVKQEIHSVVLPRESL